MLDSLKGHALVVGINDYSGGVKPLQSAVSDAKAIANCLSAEQGYEACVLVDAEATASSILEAIETDFSGRLDADSAFLLYFAGHGVAFGDGSEGPQGYLLAADAKLGDQQSWLAMDRLRQALETLPCRHMLVVLDCCFAGSFRWASTRDLMLSGRPLYDSQYQRYLGGTAWQALTSASHNETAMDVSPGFSNTRESRSVSGASHSPFALALIRGLAGDADSSRAGYPPDGIITATELFQFAQETFGDSDAPLVQTPGIWPLRPDNTGEFIFRNPRLPQNTLPDPPLDDANNPWMGLRPYGSEQAGLLFGREDCIEEILNRILDDDRSRLIAVIGASGTGKSSVVKAGVLPRLESPTEDQRAAIGDWTIVHAPRLDRDPSQGLRQAAAKLEAAEGCRLLFIDQFEELYTQCRDPALREVFLEQVLALIERSVTVVLTLRSDFEPQPRRSDTLAPLWEDARIVVPPFTGEDFRQCIEGPAAFKALYFEPQALVGELVDEVVAMPGALPMLSFALAEMYRCAQLRRRATGANDRALTRDDYDATGGVVGALHRRASALHDAGTPELQTTIQRVFLRMTAQDGARLTRRRISLAELEFADPEEQKRVQQVLAEFVEARLLVVDGETIEPAHDTLVVAWNKLLEWLSAAGPQDLIRAVWRAALDWRAGDAAKGMTWHDDPRLPLALVSRDQLNRLEQRFVDASEATRKRLIRRAIGLAAMIGIAIIGSSIVVWKARNQALEQQRIALQREAEAEVQRDRALASALLANAQAQDDPVVKGLTVAEIAARRLPAPARAAEVAREAFDQLAEPEGYIFRNGTAWDIRQIRGSDHISFQTLLGARVEDSWRFEPIHFRYRPQYGRVLANAFTSNDRSVFASYERGVTVYWPDPLNSAQAVTIAEPVVGLSADMSGRRILVGVDREVRILDLDQTSGAFTTRVLGRHDAGLAGIAMTPDGRWAVSVSMDGELRRWDVAEGDVLERQLLDSELTAVAISDDGLDLAAGSIDGQVWFRRGVDGARTFQTGQCDADVEMLTLSPGGQVLAGVCAGKAKVWNTRDLQHVATYPSSGLNRVKFVLWPDSFYPGGPWPGAFSHDGLWLVGLGVPEPPIAWPVVTAELLQDAVSRPPRGGRSAPTMDLVAEMGLIKDAGGSEPDDLPTQALGDRHHLGVRVMETATGSFEVGFVLRDQQTGQVIREHFEFPWSLEPYEFPVYVDPTGGRALAVATDGNFWVAVLFDLDAGEGTSSSVIGPLEGMLLRDVVFSPDGHRLVVLNDRMNPNIIPADPVLLDTDDLSEVRILGGQRFVAQAAFSDDGNRLATIDCYGETRLWNSDGSGDPIVFDPREEDGPYLCGDSEGMFIDEMLPSVSFGPHGDLIEIYRAGQPMALHTIGFSALSEQLRERTFACLTAAQREQFLAETATRAQAAYRACMAELEGTNKTH
jgi:WD40 repeat protein